MSRANEASEPSMDDILASIRRIISDDGQHAGYQGEPVFGEQRNSPVPAQPAGSLQEEVLDLTDELVFADQPGAQVSPEVDSAVTNAGADDTQETWSEKAHADTESDDLSVSTSAANPELMSQPFLGHPADLAPQTQRGENRPEISRSSSQGSRPIWSRRELPVSPGPLPSFHAERGGLPKDSQSLAEGPAPQSMRTPSHAPWSEDIQMPVPEQGPVSLIGEIEGSESKHEPSVRQEGEAMVVLAQTLAKSAVMALEDDELDGAGQVDFEHLDPAHRAEVADKFAEAMHPGPPQAPAPSVPYLQPPLLDEVFRQNFVTEPQRPQHEDNALECMHSTRANEVGGDVAHSSREHALTANVEDSEEQPGIPEQRAERNPPPVPVAQAQFAGATMAPSPSSASGVKTLEDSVRDMLRPMMLQWLDEHMPRILENAIREEIKTRGLLPEPAGQS